MTTLAYSAIPVYAGEIIKEELEARGISQKELAENLGVSYTMLNEILNGKRPLSSEVALLVEAALDINAEMLIGIQSRYNLQTARKDKSIKARMQSVKKMANTAAVR